MELTNTFRIVKNTSTAEALKGIPEGSLIRISWELEKSLRGKGAEVVITQLESDKQNLIQSIKVKVLINIINIHKTLEVEDIV